MHASEFLFLLSSSRSSREMAGTVENNHGRHDLRDKIGAKATRPYEKAFDSTKPADGLQHKRRQARRSSCCKVGGID
jgi:hypothetical protein